MKSFHKPILFLIVLIAINSSCNKEETFSEIQLVNSTVYSLMKDVYLWYTAIPDLDPVDFSSPQELMDELRYDVYDKWSVVITKDEYYDFDQGEMIGYGMIYGEDNEGKVRVLSVYRNTPFALQGVKRGWIISKVNGNDVTFENLYSLLGTTAVGVTNDFTFIDENSNVVNLTIAKASITITPVVYYDIIPYGGKNIGYMVFQTFIRSAYEELEEAFTAFSTEGIDELIIDLRYNTGGYLTVADTLAGWMIGDNYSGQPFVNLEFNNRYSNENTTLNVPAISAGLDLSRVFFIGTANTASASELVINGMASYIPTFLAGSTTNGKPVGMSVFEFIDYDYVVLPVTFRYTNADNEGDFFSGITPDLPAEDDITRNFGDPEEASLKAVLDFIDTGVMPAKTLKSAESRSIKLKSDIPMLQYLLEN